MGEVYLEEAWAEWKQPEEMAISNTFQRTARKKNLERNKTIRCVSTETKKVGIWYLPTCATENGSC